METEVFKVAATQGFFAVLFVVLLFYVLKTNEKREERLLTALERLTTDYTSLAKDVAEIKDELKAR